jgi:hypothetical protein
MKHFTSFFLSSKSILLVKGALFLLNPVFAIAILDLISKVHLPSFVKKNLCYKTRLNECRALAISCSATVKATLETQNFVREFSYCLRHVQRFLRMSNFRCTSLRFMCRGLCIMSPRGACVTPHTIHYLYELWIDGLFLHGF